MPGGLLDMFGIDPVANRQRRDRSSELDRTIAGELARTKLANQGQLDATKASGSENRLTQAEKAKFDLILQKMVNDGQMSIEQARTAGQIANTRAGGEESRKTEVVRGDESRKSQREIAGQAKDLENTSAGNKRQSDILAQQLGILGKSGVPFSPQNLNVYDQALTDPRIQNELQNVRQMTMARQAPGFADTLAQGLQAQNLAPAFANVQAGKMSAGPGDMVVAPPSGVTLPPADLNAWNQMQGGGKRDVLNQIPSGIPGLPPSTQMTTETTPGRIRVNPQLLQQAAGVADGGGIPGNAAAPTEDPILQMLKRLRMIQSPRM